MTAMLALFYLSLGVCIGANGSDLLDQPSKNGTGEC